MEKVDRMGNMPQEQINVDLFDEVARLKKENRKIELELKKCYSKIATKEKIIAETSEWMSRGIKRACEGCVYSVGNNHPMCKECLRTSWLKDNFKSK